MSVHFSNTDPNSLFPAASSYSKDVVDQMFSGLTTDGVTQTALTYAIEDFISETAINTIMSDLITNFISETIINNKFDFATQNFRTAEQIDSMFSGDTSEFYNTEEVNEFASGRTDDYSETQDVYDNAYSAMEASQLYWHPAPFYERFLVTDEDSYTLSGNEGYTKDIYVSGSTYWEVGQVGGGGKATPPEAWYSFSHTTGDTSLILTITAEEDNESGGVRSVDLEFSAVQIAHVPFTVTLSQNVYIPK